MLYIKNNVKYPLVFKITKNGKEEKIVFDCLRIFQDTGNIATTGVTPISEEDFDFEAFSVDVDSDCITDDFDNYDLYGEIMEGNDREDYGDDIEFE